MTSAKSLSPEVAKRLLELLQQIDALQPILGQLTDHDLNRYPSIPVSGTLDQEGVMAAFLAAIDTMRAAGVPPRDQSEPRHV